MPKGAKQLETEIKQRKLSSEEQQRKSLEKLERLRVQKEEEEKKRLENLANAEIGKKNKNKKKQELIFILLFKIIFEQKKTLNKISNKN